MNRLGKGLRSTASDSTAVTNIAPSHSVMLFWFQHKFRPHLNDWVFGPIDRLVGTQDALVGFIMMTCAIDYLAGFWWGKPTKGQVQYVYIEFIKRYFPRKYDPEGLYDSLGNGLVHMFTIKNMKYALTYDDPQYHLTKSPDGHTYLNAQDFRDDLVAAKERYFNEVESSRELLRKWWERYTRDGFLGPYPLDKVR